MQLNCHVNRIGLEPSSTIQMGYRLLENTLHNKTVWCIIAENVLSVAGRENIRSSPSEVFLEKDVLKICSKFTVEHSCRSEISIKLLCNIEITLVHGCSSVNFLHIFRTTFHNNTSGRFLLKHQLICPLRDTCSASYKGLPFKLRVSLTF